VKKELRILILEDADIDALLIDHELRKGGFSFRSTRIDTSEDLVAELDREPPDLILSDHGLPSFDGYSALETAKSRFPDVPFIFVTGRLGEEVAVDTLRRGATDYVLKTKLGGNLLPAIRRALKECEEKRKHRMVERELCASDSQFQDLITGLKKYTICILDAVGNITSWNPCAEVSLGYTANEIVGHHFSVFYRPEDVHQGHPASALRLAEETGQFEEEGWRLRKGGQMFHAKVVVKSLRREANEFTGFSYISREID
jgi:PAS domain S-box-containing protein